MNRENPTEKHNCSHHLAGFVPIFQSAALEGTQQLSN